MQVCPSAIGSIPRRHPATVVVAQSDLVAGKAPARRRCPRELEIELSHIFP
jgi:hypothetical protein